MKHLRPRLTAVVGAQAAGKDELAQYLVQQHGVLAIEIGAFARKLEEELEEDEPHIQYDVSAKKLAEFGAEYIISRLVAEIVDKNTSKLSALVITGVRTPAEAGLLKEHFGSDFQLAFVKVGNRETRYERVQKRDFTTDANSLPQFEQEDEQLKSDYALLQTAALADITLWNNGSLEWYYQQIETYIVPHLFPKNDNGETKSK